MVADGGAGIGGCVVEEVRDGFSGVGGCVRLAGRDCVERNEHCAVNCSCIVEERTNYTLYLFDL